MRTNLHPRLNSYRRKHPILGLSPADTDYGYFEIPVANGLLRVISSGTGSEWEHVSVSLANRCPTWTEMSIVKELFWGDEETVIQFHPKKAVYVNHHEYCLHLWKLAGHDCKLPPRELIA